MKELVFAAFLVAISVAACRSGALLPATKGPEAPGAAAPTPTFSAPSPAPAVSANWQALDLIGDAYALAASSDPRAPGRVYTLRPAGLLRSADAGQYWERVASFLAARPSWRLAQVLLHPRDFRVVLTLDTREDLWRSDDDGAAWRLLLKRVQAFALDPKDPRVMYAFAHNPNSVGPADRFLLRRTEDRGLTWTDVYVGCMPPEAAYSSNACSNHAGVSALLAAPDGRTLYAGTDFGVYRSLDGGGTWAAMNDGLRRGPRIYLGTPFLTMDAAGTLYAAVEANAVVRFQGESWQQANAGLPRVGGSPFPHGVNHLASSPDRPGLLAAATDQGGYITTNGGDHWVHLEDQGRIGKAQAVAFVLSSSPVTGTLYVASSTGVWRASPTLQPPGRGAP